MPPAGEGPVLALLKIAKVPFWFTWLTPFVFGYVASAGGAPRLLPWFVLVALGTCFADALCNVHNELVDQQEDAANQPNRTALLARIGEGPLRLLVGAGYLLTLVGVLAVGWVVGLSVALFIVTGAAAAVLYNCGPHFKRRRIASQFVIGSAGLSTFLSGWVWHRPLAEMPATAWVVGVFVTVMAFLKDLPDAEGDRLVGRANLFSRRPATARRVALTTVLAVPFMLVTVLVLAGAVPTRLMAVIALLPIAIWLSGCLDRARSLPALLATYQAVFVYHQLFLLAIFVLHTATATAGWAALGLFAGRTVAVALRLDPRLVTADFSWPEALRLLGRSTADGLPATEGVMSPQETMR